MLIKNPTYEDIEKNHIDIIEPDIVGIQVSEDKKRFWLCINGVAFIRISRIKEINISI